MRDRFLRDLITWHNVFDHTRQRKGIMRFILRWLATAVAVSVAIWLVPGVNIIGGNSAWGAIAIFAGILALVNMSIKPILQVLSLPISIITLGIFYLIVNTLMLYIAAWLSNSLFDLGFAMETFGSAFVASILISFIASIVNAITGANDKSPT